MLRSYRLLEWAEQDVEQTRHKYDAKHHGLGLRFANAVEAAIEYATEQPTAGQTYPHRRIRRVLRQYRVKKFPYDVITTVENDDLVVIALRAHRRKPGHWHKALKQL